ncbi:MAG: hypothetical protein ACM3X9_07705 [Bacillota bacterium]
MATLLDYRASIGSKTFGSPGSVMSTSSTTPSYIGSIGLIVGNATGIRVQLQGEIGVAATSAPATVTITIVKNASPDPTLPAGGRTILTQNYTLESTIAKTIAINAADLDPTPGPSTPGQISYSMFAQNSAGNSIIRTGPENFAGLAMTD